MQVRKLSVGWKVLALFHQSFQNEYGCDDNDKVYGLSDLAATGRSVLMPWRVKSTEMRQLSILGQCSHWICISSVATLQYLALLLGVEGGHFYVSCWFFFAGKFKPWAWWPTIPCCPMSLLSICRRRPCVLEVAEDGGFLTISLLWQCKSSYCGSMNMNSSNSFL